MQSEYSRLQPPAPASTPNSEPFNQGEVVNGAPAMQEAPKATDSPTRNPQPLATHLMETSMPSGQLNEAAQLPAVTRFNHPNRADTRPPADKPSRWLGRSIAAVSLAVVLVGSALIARGGGGEDKSAARSKDAAATANSTPTTAGEGTTEISDTPTTVSSVILSPQDEAPSVAVTIQAAEARDTNTSTTAVTAQEVETPEEENLLNALEIQKIIDATNYQGLAGHSFVIEEVFTTSAARYVVINLDGAESVVPVSELRADVEQAEADAASRPTFTSSVQLGPGITRDVTFQARPAKLTRDGTDTRYIIYTDSELDSLSAPVKGFANASTISRPYKNLNVSLIKNLPDKITDSFAANSFYAGVEVRQTTTHFDISLESEQALDLEMPDMSYISDSSDPLQKKMALANIGREIYTNSLAYAQESAEAGVPYEQYKELAIQIPLRAYQDAEVYYMAVSLDQYSSLS